MKKLFFFLLLCYGSSALAQNLPNYEEISLTERSDYKVAEPSVLQATDYILSTPFAKNDVDRLKSSREMMISLGYIWSA